MEIQSTHERLLLARHRRRWSLQEAAKAVGCTADTLSRIERGRPPSGRVAAGIERALGIPASDWFTPQEGDDHDNDPHHR